MKSPGRPSIMPNPPVSSRERFLQGAAAWIQCHSRHWQWYWLAAPCCLLEHARETGCDFDREVLDTLALLEEARHEQVAEQLYKYFVDPRPPEHNNVFCQAAQLMKGMIDGVRAAMALVQGGPWASASPPNDFVDHAEACCRAYQAAWPLGADDPKPIVQPGPLHAPAPLTASKDRAGMALQAIVGRYLDLRVPTWLAVRRLLDYVLPRDGPPEDDSPDGSPEGDPVEARMLAYLPHVRSPEENKGEGRVCDIHAYRQVEGHFGFYLDPVAMGLTLVDPSMLTSLDLAWRACRPEIQRRLSDSGSHPLPAIRLSPQLPGGPGQDKGAWQLAGDSAGGLFACAMYAAATGDRLNTDASASVALRLREGCSPQADLEIADILVHKVSEESVRPKLRAAKREGIRRVVLEKKQEQWARQWRRVPEGLEVVGAENLSQVYEAITGDAKIERVLTEYCEQMVKSWDKCRKNPCDPDKLTHYIEPHYSLLEEGFSPADTSLRVPVRETEGEAPPKDPYHPVAGPDDSAETELLKLIRPNRLLCITEDAGAGKTIFTRRLVAFLCSPPAWKALFKGKPPLVVRWEESVSQWPEDYPAALMAAVESTVKDLKSGASARQVVESAIQDERVVLVLDALDQVSESTRWRELRRFLNTADGRRCRVVLTSRSYAVSARAEGLFRESGWRYGRIDRFTRQQQREYLDPWDFDRLFPNYDEVAELLSVPVVLGMVRQLREQGQLVRFASRAELYLQASSDLIARAARKIEDEFESADVLRLEEILAAVAFQMMLDGQYGYAVRGLDAVARLRRAAAERCSRKVSEEDWKMVQRATGLMNRCLLEASTTEMLSFKHRGMMEFYCGLFLARNQQPGWVTSEQYGDGRTTPRCGDPALRPFVNDENWKWAWQFAIEMPPEAREPEVLCASLAELFVPREEGQGRRPTELMYRAWHLFEVDALVLREIGLSAEQGRQRILPGAAEVVACYRHREGEAAESIENLIREGFVRCPRNPEEDGKPFQMGSPEGEGENDERPQHAVTVTPFRMQATPVTRAQYRVFDPDWERVEADRINDYSVRDACPAIFVSWHDAFAFAKWLGAGFRLPTEAEWEYACRAGSTTAYCFGDSQEELGEYAWYFRNAVGPTNPVGQKKPNGWGLYDMHGNVCEWCWDRDGSYGDGPLSDPVGPDTGWPRVARGDGLAPIPPVRDDWRVGRAAKRDSAAPCWQFVFGFRLARVGAD